MTPDTPTPYTPPDGVVLTKMAEARRIGHGEITDLVGGADWERLNDVWSDNAIVCWRPTPERTVTIELPESEVRRIADTCWWSETGDDVVHEAARAAVARLDGDT